MAINIEKVTVTDELGMLAVTAQVAISNAERTQAPQYEFVLATEGAHTTATNIRPDGRILDIRVSSDGSGSHLLFSGKVEHVDDITGANEDQGALDLSRLPRHKNYLKKITKVYNAEPVGLASVTGTTGVLGPYKAKAHYIIRQLCKLVGLSVGRLDFPDYNVVGEYPIEHETVIEIVTRLVAPFNLFKFKKYLVRIDDNILSVVHFDFLHGFEISNPYVCQNVLTTKRSFSEYVPEPVIGDSKVVLTGAMRPDELNNRIEPEQLDNQDVPQMVNPDDWTAGASVTSFQLKVYLEEKKIEETVKTNSNESSGRYANPAYQQDGTNDPDPTPHKTTVEVQTDMLTHILLTGYDSTLPSKLASATTILTNLQAYARFLGFATYENVIAHMKLDYPSLTDAELVQKADERYGRVVRKRGEFQAIVDQLTEASLTTTADSIPGTTISDEDKRLSYIDKSDYNLVPVYGPIDPATGEPTITSVVLAPLVEYGDVIYVQNIVTLASVPVKIKTFQHSQGENDTVPKLAKESLTLNDYVIRKYEFEKRLIHYRSSTESFTFDLGIKVPEEKVVRQMLFDDTGDLVQTTVEKYTDFRGEWALYNVDIEMDVKSSIEYSLQTFEDGRRRLVPALKQFELGKTRRDLRQEWEDGRAGYHPVTMFRPEPHLSARWTELSERIPMGHYLLVDGKHYDEASFLRNLNMILDSASFLGSGTNELTLDDAARSSARITSLLNTNESKSLFKLNFPHMDAQGLKLIWDLCEIQKDLEKNGAEWEIATHTLILDTTPNSGMTGLCRGTSGVIDYVQHEVTANYALSTVRTVKINEFRILARTQ